MAYRYCPECNEWYKKANYTVNESGETVCKEETHGSVHGYIDGSIASVEDFRQHTHHSNMEDEIEAAVRQGLLTN